MKDPIDSIEWMHASELKANHYNPNVVFNMELDLLELSILRQGWVQPILVSRDRTIIDGYHRWRLARDPGPVNERYAGRCPVVVLDIPPHEAMMTTIRMNRAKGTHVAVRMAGLVQELIDTHHCDEQEIAKGIGGTVEEVRLLYQNSIFKERNLDDYAYSKAWVPKDNGKLFNRGKKRTSPRKSNPKARRPKCTSS